MGSFEFESIKVFVTSYCNLNCTHCYQYFDKNRYQLQFEKIREIVDFAVENRTKTLDFSGGEFFTHPFAYEILEYCLSKHINVNISTNATNIDMSFFKKHRETDFITIQISIDGTEQTHDARRGRGMYQKAINSARALNKLGFKVSASMALDEANYLDAIEVLNISYFSNVYFLPVALVGAAKINSSESVSLEYEETVYYVMKRTDCATLPFAEQIFPHVLAIRYDGGVYISPAAADYDLMCFGNINTESLNALIERFYASDDFKQITAVDNDNIEACNKCRVAKKCGRGCRLRALKFFGNMISPDPFYCRIYNNEFNDIPLGRLFWGEK